MKALNVYLGRDLKPFVGFLSFSDKGSHTTLLKAKSFCKQLSQEPRAIPQWVSIILYNYG